MMRKKNKRCVLILPYFGQFNNYFPLFLKSCEANPTYIWMIFTDNEFKYACPENVHVIKTTLDEIRKIWRMLLLLHCYQDLAITMTMTDKDFINY